jgi:hypothetical protein
VENRLLAAEDHPKDVRVPDAVQDCNSLGDERAKVGSRVDASGPLSESKQIADPY